MTLPIQLGTGILSSLAAKDHSFTTHIAMFGNLFLCNNQEPLKTEKGQMQWYMPLIRTLGRKREVDLGHSGLQSEF